MLSLSLSSLFLLQWVDPLDPPGKDDPEPHDDDDDEDEDDHDDEEDEDEVEDPPGRLGPNDDPRIIWMK